MGSERVIFRLPPDLLARLQARAIARGVTRSEVCREALRAHLASEPEIRPLIPDIKLDEAVSSIFDLSIADARAQIRLGQIEVDGRVERRLRIPPGEIEPGQALRISRN